MVIAMAGRQVRRRAFGLVGLFVLAGFRQQFAAFVLKPVVGDLDRDGPRLQIAGFEDELGLSTPAVTGRLHWVQVGHGRASAADHPLTTRYPHTVSGSFHTKNSHVFKS